MSLRFQRKEDTLVSAIRLKLEFSSLEYQKWGDNQRALPGDWLVDNDGDVYTVAADSFAQTYENVSPGRWRKCTHIWATQALVDGSVETQEGRSHYKAGDWIVSNDEAGTDAYAISAEKFQRLYEPL
ncbi:MAG: hypothetical protein AB8B87_23480 [Granulosicoccus sp.]